MPIENLEQLPDLVFEYSPESELLNVIGTLERNARSPYAKQGYSPRLPKGVALDKSEFSEEFDEEILEKIRAEFDQDKIAKAERYKDFIRNNWPEIIDKLKRLFTEIGLPMPDSYEIQFTDYGVGGRFNPPNKIIIRFADEKIIAGLKNVIIHEAIHDAIQPILNANQEFSDRPNYHWERELLVDSLMEKVVSDMPAHGLLKDRLPEEKQVEIKKVFEQNYPDLVKILEEISKLKEK